MWQTLKRVFGLDAAQNSGAAEMPLEQLDDGALVALSQDLGRSVDEIRAKRAQISAILKARRGE